MTDQANRGKELERRLQQVHDRYWRDGHTWIAHNRVAGSWRGKRFVPMPDKAAPDFYGCDRGKFLAFEAKESRKPRWRLDRRFGHQHERLRGLALARATAWFAVEHVPSSELWLLRIWPQSEWPVLDFRSPAGSPDLLRLTVDPDGLYDWLPAIRAHWL